MCGCCTLKVHPILLGTPEIDYCYHYHALTIPIQHWHFLDINNSSFLWQIFCCCKHYSLFPCIVRYFASSQYFQISKGNGHIFTKFDINHYPNHKQNQIGQQSDNWQLLSLAPISLSFITFCTHVLTMA